MFGRLIAHMREARGTDLKRQFENASLHLRDLGDEQAERFGRGLNHLFNDWVDRFGPVKDCEVPIRKRAVKEMRTDARRRYEHDMGAAYAIEFLSYHIEASYLPGEDAAFVYDMTSYYISQNADAARKGSGQPRVEGRVQFGQPLIRAASALGGAMGRVLRMRLGMLAVLAAWVGLAEPAIALDKVKFETNWLADPEAGGFFQAVADGTYAKYGLDVTVIPGGPQTNGALMLLFGKIDFFMGGDLIGDFMSAESKLPLVAVAAYFQKSPQILMSHPGVGLDKWEDLPKANSVYLGAGSINTFYAWLRLVYGFKDEAVRPYNFNSAPFIQNKTSVQQGYVTSEPYEIEKQGGFKPNVFLLSDYGYSTYSTLIETRRDTWRKSLTSCSASSTLPRSAGTTISMATIPGRMR